LVAETGVRTPMSYVAKNLVAGESLVYETGVHWSVLVWPVLIAIVVGAGATACFFEKQSDFLYAGAALMVVAVAIVAVAAVKRSATEIAVTNRRVIIKTGWAHRRSVEIMLPKVESIGITEPFMGRVLGYGTVVVRGTGGTPEPFDKIAHPSEFRKHVHEQADRSRT
jgi:uncharacterized membrane protein YdbT with pleckstrin-like domain